MPTFGGDDEPVDDGEVKSEWVLLNTQEIAMHWAGHPIHGDIYTHKDHQFVAFYDENRRMTVAQRELGSTDWTFDKLDETVGWDSHNGINIVVGPDEHIHLSGNMHNDPLVYFRSAEPLDITTMQRIDHMSGDRENVVTYPTWIYSGDGTLLFKHRGGQGYRNAVALWKKYDPETQSWSLFLNEPPFSNEPKDGTDAGSVNFSVRTKRGPDGWIHRFGLWRETPDVYDTRDPSYVRTKDYKNYETIDGQSLDRPISINDDGIRVDEVPTGNGLLPTSNAFNIGFDTHDNVVLSYYKHTGNATNVFNARYENGEWQLYQTSDWDHYFDVRGIGSFGKGRTDILISEVYMEDGTLYQDFEHVNHGKGRWVLDEETLTPVDTVPQRSSEFPEHVNEFQDLKQKKTAFDFSNTHWIWHPELDPYKSEKNAAPDEKNWFRTEFTVPSDKNIIKAKWAGTTGGVVKGGNVAYLNGAKIGDADTAWAVMPVYDVTDMMNSGDNALGLYINKKGWYAGAIGQLYVEYEDGSVQYVNTNNTWKVAKSVSSDWATPGYNDSEWKRAIELGPIFETRPWADQGGVNAPGELPYDIQVNWTNGAPGEWEGKRDKSCHPFIAYYLRWESAATNADAPRDIYPDPVPLRLYTFVKRDAIEIDFAMPSSVNIEEQGTIPVRITSDVDLDFDSLQFGTRGNILGCKGAGSARVKQSGKQPIVHFPASETGFEPDDDTAMITGRTADGTPVFGTVQVDITGSR